MTLPPPATSLQPPTTSRHRRRLAAILERFRDSEPRPGAEWRHVKGLWREYLHPHRFRLLLALLLATALGLSQYLWAYLGNQITADLILRVGKDPVAPEKLDLHALWILLLFVNNSLLHAAIAGLQYSHSYQITLVGQRVVFALRRALYERLQRLPIAFFDSIQTGRLLSVLVDDVETIRASVASTALQTIVAVLSLLTGAAIILSRNPLMGIIVILALPAYAAVIARFRPRIKEAHIAARRATAILYGRMEERVSGVRTVKVFGRERAEVRSFADLVHALARLMLHVVRLSASQTAIATAISAVATTAVLAYGLSLVRSGAMSVGDVLFFYTSSALMFAPAVTLGELAVNYQRISVILRRVFDIIEEEEETPDPPHATSLPHARGDLALHDVTFAYPDHPQPALLNLTFAVPAGARLAVLGPSGAGKTTLLSLLMRFHDPDSGSITLDGHDLRGLQRASLRARITLVLQEPVIFSGSVADNIRYGDLDASDADVQRAARDADLHDFITTLPDGYDTTVGERGISLSGGQRQRLALAASLLSQPAVLLLDDTTSALDAATEARVSATLSRVMRGRTCVVVTHRASTALSSDLVLVLEGGRVTQFGTPQQLLAEEGLLRRVTQQQAGDGA